MFGINWRVNRRLRRRGRPATATVLSIRRQAWAMFMMPDVAVDPGPARQEVRALWKMAVRVEPEGEPAFSAKVFAWLGVHSRPSEGWAIPVLYDPHNHRRVAFDPSLSARLAADRASSGWLAARAQKQFEELFGTQAQDPESPVERLTNLLDLRDRGLVTNAEYEAQRRKLLGQ